jgi:hypothetical protein
MASVADTKRTARRLASKPAPAFVVSRVASTLDTAAAAGLTAGKKSKRLSGRAHQALFEAAVARTGLDGSDLLEYALAKVAIEDDFTEKLMTLQGSISRDIDLEF